jgi:hypothetical protein
VCLKADPTAAFYAPWSRLWELSALLKIHDRPASTIAAPATGATAARPGKGVAGVIMTADARHLGKPHLDRNAAKLL